MTHAITLTSRVCLAPSARLEWDRVRTRWVLQAPERLYWPDETALLVLRRCGGRIRLADVVAALAIEHDADLPDVTEDVLEFLQELADKGLVVDGAA